MDSKKIDCIICPIGCEISVIFKDTGFCVKGNRCIKGEKYAIDEMVNPKRIITSTIKIKNGFLNRLPVRSDKSIPRDEIFKILEIINSISIDAPIKMGDIIINNVLGLNVNIIASRSMDRI